MLISLISPVLILGHSMSSLHFSSLFSSPLLFSCLLLSSPLLSSCLLFSSPLLFSCLIFSSLLISSLHFSFHLFSSLLFSSLLFSSLLFTSLLFSPPLTSNHVVSRQVSPFLLISSQLNSQESYHASSQQPESTGLHRAEQYSTARTSSSSCSISDLGRQGHVFACRT